MSHDGRMQVLKVNRLCANCLSAGHFKSQCKSLHRWKMCQRPHHTLLHLDSPSRSDPKQSTTQEDTSIGSGYCNWKDAVTRSNAHQSTIWHKDAVLKTITLPKTTQDIGEHLSRQHAHKKCERRQCLLHVQVKLLSNIHFWFDKVFLFIEMNPKVTMYSC